MFLESTDDERLRGNEDQWRIQRSAREPKCDQITGQREEDLRVSNFHDCKVFAQERTAEGLVLKYSEVSCVYYCKNLTQIDECSRN